MKVGGRSGIGVISVALYIFIAIYAWERMPVISVVALGLGGFRAWLMVRDGRRARLQDEARKTTPRRGDPPGRD